MFNDAKGIFSPQVIIYSIILQWFIEFTKYLLGIFQENLEIAENIIVGMFYHQEWRKKILVLAYILAGVENLKLQMQNNCHKWLTFLVNLNN